MTKHAFASLAKIYSCLFVFIRGLSFKLKWERVPGTGGLEEIFC